MRKWYAFDDCCAYRGNCIHIPGDEGDEWYCKKRWLDNHKEEVSK